MAPHLTANLLTVTFFYCVARITQMERNGQEARATHLWLTAMVLLFASTASTSGSSSGAPTRACPIRRSGGRAIYKALVRVPLAD